jgi:hypothetical protein
MLHQRLELAPRFLLRIVHFLEPIQPQQLSQFEGIDAVTLIGIVGKPGVGGRMRANYALHQRRNHCSGPGRQFTRFQMYVQFTAQVQNAFLRFNSLVLKLQFTIMNRHC